MVKNNSSPLDQTFRALADPTRRAIIEQLSRGEAFVGELAEPFDMSWPAVTKHLRVLESAGLLVQEKQGNARKCRLVVSPLQQAHAWIERYEAFWQMQLDALADYFQTAHPMKRKKSGKGGHGTGE